MREDLYNEIAKVAYDLHEKRGRKHGNDLEDWLEAEKVVLTRYEEVPGKEKAKVRAKVKAKRSSGDAVKKSKKKK